MPWGLLVSVVLICGAVVVASTTPLPVLPSLPQICAPGGCPNYRPRGAETPGLPGFAPRSGIALQSMRRTNDVIDSKGRTVITARAEQPVSDLVRLLAENRIGTVVITDSDDRIVGIAGERDVVRALHDRGTSALDDPISSLMTAEVHVCGMSDELSAVAAAMTEMRVRHFPVVVDGQLAAIVSIGDSLVKSRIDQLQSEQEQLVNYLQATGPDRVTGKHLINRAPG